MAAGARQRAGSWVTHLRYLKSRRSRSILAYFAVSTLLLVQFPAIDIEVSRLFFNGTFRWSEQWWQPLIRGMTTVFLAATLILVFTLFAWNVWTKHRWGRIDGRKVAYLCLVLLIGPGLIVNAVLKDNFGRARPRDVTEFGGTKVFTAAFVVSHECRRNCSFSSGEGAAGFFAVTLALTLSRRRSVLVAALAFGCLVSFARLASGAHFLSDIVVSFFVMMVVTDLLRCYMLVEAETPLLIAVPERSGT